jgi:phage terminase large subunit GpA-like protein
MPRPSPNLNTDTELEALSDSLKRRDLYQKSRPIFRQKLQNMRSYISPREKMLPSEWAERYGLIDPINPAAGTIKLFNYQKELLDCVVDPDVSEISILKSARVGATRLMTLAIGFFLEQDPQSVMLVQPTVSDAEDFSGSEIMPMLQNTPVLAELKRGVSRGIKQDTQTDFQFLNGSILRLRGAASDASFRRVATSVGFGDEIDALGWQPKKNSEGSKLDLFRKRGMTKDKSKFYWASTPTWKHSSLIEPSYLNGDQRKWHVKCPHCSEYQVLQFGGKETDHGLKWKINEYGHVEDAWMVCIENGCIIEEFHKNDLDQSGEWRPTSIPKKPGHRSYHLWSGISLFKKAGWKYLAQEFLDAKGNPEKLMVFVNTILGESFDARADLKPEVSIHELSSNLQSYNPTSVPNSVDVLTAGVDVQTGKKSPTKAEEAARVEVSIWGHAKNNTSYLISHTIIAGKFSDSKLQANLDTLLTTPVIRQDGTQLIIQATAIDLGGHYTEQVKAFCNGRMNRNVWAVKGKNNKVGTRSGAVWPKKPSRKERSVFYLLDTQLQKDIFFDSLNSGRIHFPIGTQTRYFKGISSETKIAAATGGFHWSKLNKSAYGEPLDCAIYAFAALHGLKRISKRWRSLDSIQDAKTTNVESPKNINLSETIVEDNELNVLAIAPKPPNFKNKKRGNGNQVRSKFLR